MATSISALTSLESLVLEIRHPSSPYGIRRPPPPPLTSSRSILSILATIWFKGSNGYLEEILARIDAPRLNVMYITFSYHITFDTRRLFQFISRSPTLTTPEKSYIDFDSKLIVVRFPSPSQTSDADLLTVEIQYAGLPQLVRLCASSFKLPPVSTLEDLYIHHSYTPRPNWQDYIFFNRLWLELVQPFAAVKNLYLSEYCAHPAKTCRTKNGRSFAQTGEYFLGEVSAVGTPP